MPAERPGEFERIRAIVAALPAGEGVVLGPGDDAAVLRTREGFDLVMTTDAFVEGRHYRRDLLDAPAIGRRLAAANLSDLAAMGATPRWATIACGASASAAPDDLRAIELSCARALAAEGACVVGGNLSGTKGPTWWSVTLLGEVECGRHWARAGARAKDVLAVTGHPGRAAAALALALWGVPPSFAHAPAELAEVFRSPPCRVGAARAMSAVGGVRAAIDLSDGFAGDLHHLVAASGVGARVDEAALPEDPLLWQAARTLGAQLGHERSELLPPPEQGLVDHLRFGPSDDYELLLAIDPERFVACAAAAREAGALLTAFGVVTSDAGRVVLKRASGVEELLPGRGWDHFA